MPIQDPLLGEVGGMNADTKPDLATLSFEDALAELEGIVRDLEAGQGSLEDAIAGYTRGAALRDHCDRKLREAQTRIETISRRADGDVATTPFDSE